VLRLKPKGCWWCFGKVGESDADDGGRVPKDVYRAKHQTPAVLQSDDEIQFVLKDGRIVQS
jgi:hypothetical protein